MYIYIYIIVIYIYIVCIVFNTLNLTHRPHNHQNFFMGNHAYKVHKVLFADKALCVSQARKL